MNSKLLSILAATASAALLLVGCNQSRTVADANAAVSVGKAQPPAAATKEEKVLRIRNWPDYLPEGVLEEFELETGIKVEYKTFASNEDVMALVARGTTDADIVVPGSAYAAIMIEKGWLRPLDLSLLPNAKNLDPAIMKLLVQADPSNRYLVPWAWGFTTVGINRTKVDAALGGAPLPANTWELVFNPDYTTKLKSCGIAFLDSPSEVIPAAAHFAGKKAYSNVTADHEAAAQVIRAVRGDIKQFSSKLIDNLSDGSVCATLGWSGDINQAADKARKAGSKDLIEALIPSTGAMSFFDTMAIPKTSKHPENAHAFINFMLRPSNAARIITEVGYPTGNIAARALVDKNVAGNTSIFVSKENIAKMVAPSPTTLEARASMIAQYLSVAYGFPVVAAK